MHQIYYSYHTNIAIWFAVLYATCIIIQTVIYTVYYLHTLGKTHWLFQVKDGLVSYGKLVNRNIKVTDGQWHSIKLIVESDDVKLTVDDVPVTLNNTRSADFLDIYTISSLTVGDQFEGM